MTYTLTQRGKTSTINSKTLVSSGGGQNTAQYAMNADIVTSATTNTIVLGASASAVNNFYDNKVIQINNVNGEGQYREIISYVGGTKTATVSIDWDLIPLSGDTYIIHQNSGACPTQTAIGASRVQIQLSSNDSSVNGFYNDSIIAIVYDNGDINYTSVAAYIAATKIAVLRQEFFILPTNTTLYILFGESGTATNGSSTTIELDGNQSSLAGTQHLYIDVYEGTGAGQIRQITSLSTNTLTISPAWVVIPGGWF